MAALVIVTKLLSLGIPPPLYFAVLEIGLRFSIVTDASELKMAAPCVAWLPLKMTPLNTTEFSLLYSPDHCTIVANELRIRDGGAAFAEVNRTAGKLRRCMPLKQYIGQLRTARIVV